MSSQQYFNHCIEANMPHKQSSSTSWEEVQKWYKGKVGEKGLYYHQKVILPGVLKLLDLASTSNASVLDIACGEGILARSLPKDIPYVGIDNSKSLIKEAQKKDSNPNHSYIASDATKPFPMKGKTFSHAAIILALQNIDKPEFLLKEVAKHLQPHAKLVIVINHPCFRIPRHTSWGIDKEKKLQYRRIDSYSSSYQIPIQMHPSKGESSQQTWSFHFPLSELSRWLHDAGFCIALIEEWHSDKQSTGGAARMENRSRNEIPLFLTILAIKIT